ncbi:MAG TPA: type II toxin-antitoxin system PemK/MazF family toxin [Gaiellaceae bacterium]|nr:type II toxin-antitoxin system PemK/MazF family toxin [Gaiellaceae bacterium]
MPAQGDIWWAETEERKRRPVLVVTRTTAAPVLRRVVVAPITRTVRRIPTEIPLDEADGLVGPCAASFDNLQPIPRALLTERIGAVAGGHAQICRALAALADC